MKTQNDMLMKTNHQVGRVTPCASSLDEPACGGQRTARPTLRAAALLLCLFTATFAAHAGTPVIGVYAFQHLPTDANPKYVEIDYSLYEPDYPAVSTASVNVQVSSDGGATWTVPAHTFVNSSATVGPNVPLTSTTTFKTITWDAGADWDGNYTAHCRVRVLVNAAGLAFIRAGTYNRGDNLDGESDAPVYPVYVSAFYMDTTLVTGGKWNLVVQGYGNANGYDLSSRGAAKASNHPEQFVDWYNAVKWCNARSEMEGATPVYYTDAGFTTVYKTGEVEPYVKPGANGYRLPTEAEWEKAARGGLNGKRFPWGDNIDETLANYQPGSGQSYDLGGTQTYATGAPPWTSPVGSGSFPANGYGLYDMAGNVFEWCGDWYSSSYYSSGQTDPQGPLTSQSNRVLRGGSWDYGAKAARCADRNYVFPYLYYDRLGFRCVRGL